MDNAGALLEQVKRLEQARQVEQVERLEQDLSDLTAEPGENRETAAAEVEKPDAFNDENSADTLKSMADKAGEGVDRPDFLSQTPEKTEEEAANLLERPGDDGEPARPADILPHDEEQRGERSALAAQVEELERAVFTLAAPVPGGQNLNRPGQTGEGRGDGYPVPLSLFGPRAGSSQPAGVSEAERTGGDAAPAFRSDLGGELLWAEQADRAFRRDSRRYDGGFYLY